jgi:hypothetical protein
MVHRFIWWSKLELNLLKPSPKYGAYGGQSFFDNHHKTVSIISDTHCKKGIIEVSWDYYSCFRWKKGYQNVTVSVETQRNISGHICMVNIYLLHILEQLFEKIHYKFIQSGLLYF